MRSFGNIQQSLKTDIHAKVHLCQLKISPGEKEINPLILN